VFVVLRTYDNYIQANLALGKLLDAGIHAKTASAMLGIMEDEYKSALSCPACGSEEVEPFRGSGRGFFRKFLDWLTLSESHYRCKKCGQEFDPGG
jgi:predicted RNA-binding Zn-ribbon protein involved in translation (DUF1610 family)